MALAIVLAAAMTVEAIPSGATAPISIVVGVGVFNSAGRVSTLEMVGLNPQPEPPSRQAIVLHTSGARAVLIRLTCATSPDPRTFVATGQGTNGLWYRISIRDRGLLSIGADRARDIVGIDPVAVPPNPCQPPVVTRSLIAGDFIVR